ncbi:putative zinc transporter msc2 [Ascosphaera acerosa]|nr:putative zinc transporter msc2 [Ascosphaera acerosa]
MHGIFLHILADTLGSVAVVISTILVHYYKWSGFDPIASCMIAILIFASAVPLVASTSKSLLLELPADVEYAVRESLGEVGSLRGVVGYAKPRFWLDDRGSDDSHGDMHGHAHHDHTSHDHDCHHDDGMHSLGHHHHHDHQHHDCSPVRHSTGVAHTSPSLLAATRVPVLGAIHIFASRNADLDDVRRRVAGLLRSRNMDITVQVEREGDSRCWCGGSNACKLS